MEEDFLNNKEDMFDRYGFEKPNIKQVIDVVLLGTVSRKECVSLKDGRREQDVIVGYLVCDDGIVTTEWELSGINCDDGSNNLTLKKEWYKYEINFPEIVIDSLGRIEMAIGFDKDKLRMLVRNDLYSNLCNNWKKFNTLKQEQEDGRD